MKTSHWVGVSVCLVVGIMYSVLIAAAIYFRPGQSEPTVNVGDAYVCERQDQRQQNFEAAVSISAGASWGSGVAYRNGNTTFVWTAAHVIDHVRMMKAVVDAKDGSTKWVATYEDVEVCKERVDHLTQRKVGGRYSLAKVIRFSTLRNDGEDLALLRLYDDSFLTSSVVFSPTELRPGRKLYHVGSMSGPGGAESYSEGIFSREGRLRSNGHSDDHANPYVVDQITLSALSGSSGGGVFDERSNSCVGLLTEGLASQAEAVNLMVPARRILAYAKRSDCQWAVSQQEIPEDYGEITDRDIPLPKLLVMPKEE